MSDFFGKLMDRGKDDKKENKKDSSKNTNDEDIDDSRNDNNAEPVVDREALIKQLGILNFSLENIYIIAVAIFINIEFINIEIVKVKDQLNDTNFSKGLPDDTDWPKLTNLMYLYVTGAFLLLNYNLYKEAIDPQNSITKKEENRAFRAFLSSLLIFIATGLSKANLEI